MKYTHAIPVTALALLLGACGQTNLEKRAEILNSTSGAQTNDMKDDTISFIPDWYTEPKQKPEAVYSAGTAISQDLQFSVDKAVLDAKVALADRINGKLSASQKRFLAETSGTKGSKNMIYENEKVAKNVIAEVAVNGYSVHKTKIVRDGHSYRAFVMLEFPLGDANDVLAKLTQRDLELRAKIRSKKAFKELKTDTQEIIATDLAKKKVEIEELRN
jgi:hypothetical protein